MNGAVSGYYESSEMLRQYLEFHYGPSYFGVPNYPRRCAELALAGLRQLRGEALADCRALELGCAVGRAAFELARVVGEVSAIDLSATFIEAAQCLQQSGELDYAIDREGELRDSRHVSLLSLGLEPARGRVRFSVADACAFEDGSAYDLVLAGNLIDRLTDPEAFLRRLPRLVTDNGVLAISSPYTLRPEFTPRERWLGGFIAEGGERTVRERMQEVLDSVGFEPLGEPQNVPFVIRETARKFQHTVAEMTLWRRRP